MTDLKSNSAFGAMCSPEPAWLETAGGWYYDALDPKPAMFEDLHTIALQLGRQTRYVGAYKESIEFYSVADHLVLCDDLMQWWWPRIGGGEDRTGTALRLACLMHDVPEAFLHDVVSPLKFALRTVEHERWGGEYEGSLLELPPVERFQGAYDILTEEANAALTKAHAMPRQILDDPVVKRVDMWALRIEAERITVTGGSEWHWEGELPHRGRLPYSVPFQTNLPRAAALRWEKRVTEVLDEWCRLGT